MVDANDEKLNTAELELIKKFKSEKMTVVLAINKIDMLKDKTELMKKLAELSALYDFKAIVPVSAQSGDGLDALLATVQMPSGIPVRATDLMPCLTN